MSGRGRGNSRRSGRGYSGRGSRCSNNNSNNKSTPSGSSINRKKVFEPYYAWKQHNDTYDAVKQQVIFRIQKMFEDSERIIRTIREEDDDVGKPTKPVLKVESFTKEILEDPVQKVEMELKQRGNEIRYQEELRVYQEREK